MNSDKTTTIQTLKDKVESFVTQREWEPFHTPKNLAMALAIEAAELMEPFRYTIDNKEDSEIIAIQKEAIANELADILHLVFAFANRNSIDLTSTFLKKMEMNALKYPIEQSKGKNKKYHHYQKKY